MAESIFDKAPQTYYRESLRPVSWEGFESILLNRRSVRVYGPDPIPEAVVRRCLSAALLAPNSSNLQPWEFYWVRTPAMREKIIAICLSQPAARTAQELIVCVARTKTWPKHRAQMLELFAESQKNGPKTPASVLSYYKKLVPLAYSQGVLGWKGLLKRGALFIRGLRAPTPREPVSEAQMRLWAVKSTALACENLMLAFSASGFDSCPMEGFDSARLKKALRLARDAVPVMIVSAGRRAENGVYGPRLRFSEDQFIKEV